LPELSPTTPKTKKLSNTPSFKYLGNSLYKKLPPASKREYELGFKGGDKKKNKNKGQKRLLVASDELRELQSAGPKCR
jgi:hypothetical protein